MVTEANRRAIEGLFGDGEATLSVEDEYNLRSDDYVAPFDPPARRAGWVEPIPDAG